MKIGMISSYPPERCGVADYTAGYNRELQKNVAIREIMVPLETPNPIHYVMAALSARKCDVVHVQYEPSLYGRILASGIYTPLLYLLLLGKPVVTTIHEVDKPGEDTIKDLFYWFLYRFIGTSRTYIVHTKETAERLRKHLPGAEISVIPHPVFSPRRIAENMDDCKKIFEADGKRVLTIFGFLVESKGHIYALEALKDLPVDTVLMITGEPRNPRETDYFRALEDHAKWLGVYDRVKFTGHVPELMLPELFAATDIVLFPYTSVAASSALNKAIAYQRPIIASDLPSFIEVAAESTNINTFACGQSNELRERILETLSAGTKNKPDAYAEKYSIENTARRIVDIYKSMKP